MKYYILLETRTGNVGDDYILSACKNLLEHYKGRYNYEVYHIKDQLEKYIDEINDSDALILCGGPIYGSMENPFYPDYVKLTKNLEEIKIPIIPFGVGAFPSFDDLHGNKYFTDKSIVALRFIHRNIKYSSVRDNITKKLLNDLGLYNVITTGCPTLFMPHESRKKIGDINIKNIAVSVGHGHFHDKRLFVPNRLSEATVKRVRDYKLIRPIRFIHKSINFDYNKNYVIKKNHSLLEAVAKRFGDCNLYCTLHGTGAGLGYDRIRKRVVEELGYEIIELKNLEEMDRRYNKIDLHIGFRVHAHIWFLSRHKPSFLIHEDGRGKAFSDTFQLKNDIDWLSSDFATKIINNADKEIENRFSGFNNFNKQYLTYLNNMEEFMGSIP